MKLKEVMKEIAEQSAGIIVYRINSENIPEFLLLNGDAIGWGFPKVMLIKERILFKLQNEKLTKKLP